MGPIKSKFKTMSGKDRQGWRMRRVVGTTLAMLFATVLLAAPATAKQIFPYHYDTTFDGTGSTGGKFTPGIHNVAVNESNGNIYVSDEQAPACSGASYPQTITQLTSAGLPQTFSGVEGISTLCVSPETFVFGQQSLYFDNTGHNTGLFWGSAQLYNFAPSGVLKPNYPYRPGVTPISEYSEQPARDTAIGQDGSLWVVTNGGLRKRDPVTTKNLGSLTEFWVNIYPNGGDPGLVEIDSNGYMYFSGSTPGVKKYEPESELTLDVTGKEASTDLVAEFGPRTVRAMAIDTSNDHVFVLEGCCEDFLGEEVTEYTADGVKIQTFGLPEGPYGGLQEAEGIAVNSNTHDVYVARRGANPGVDVLNHGPAITVPDTTTLAAQPAPTSAVLKGTINPDGFETTECRFEWGLTRSYSSGTTPCTEGNAFVGSADVPVSAPLTGLTTGKTYHYRLAAKNANDHYSYGADRTFEAAGSPKLSPPVLVGEVNTDAALLQVDIDPFGGTTRYWVEYGAEDCASSACAKYPADGELLDSNLGVQVANLHLPGLTPSTEYHFRFVAQNGTGTAMTPDQTFTTFPTNPTKDICPNVQVRQQTTATLLMDCRAYELVSAQNAGGYDVESNLVPGQQPLPALPDAHDKLLYALHFGLVPGVAGSPPNYERDPYVATRGTDGWSTRYVGVPSTAGAGESEPFGSPLGAASSDLSTFAFVGDHLCAPCFDDGSTGIPVRLPDGRLVQGMAGTLDPGPSADQAGFVRQALSADGTQLVFGSTAQFEPDGNDNGDVTLYERDLVGETTRVISKTTGGNTMSGTDIGEVDISGDGSRVLLARKVGPPDSAGNDYLHLYMHLGNLAATADVTPGTSTGVLFAGMTGDGQKVFFTTKDSLVGGDTDTSVDLYEADVAGPSDVDVRLLSIGSGGSGDTDACSPIGEPQEWNAVTGTEGKCSVVVFAGGSGVAKGDGTVYFVSPEKLDGGSNGEEDQANLYVVRPGGSPEFVATMDSSTGKAGPPAPTHPLVTESFITGLSTPESIAVDQTNGDVYVSERGDGRVSRFTSAGAPKPFSALASNQITGQSLGGAGEGQIAVDSAASSPFQGALYVTTNGSAVRVYANNGEKLGELTGFSEACGVSVDQSTGTLYVGNYPDTVYQFVPTASGAPGTVTKANYQAEKSIKLTDVSVCNVDADSTGHVYAKSYFFGGKVKQYSAGEFAPSPPSLPGLGIESGNSMQSNPDDSNLYINQGTEISQFDSAGNLVQSFGSGSIGSGSGGVGVDSFTDSIYATKGNDLVKFGSEDQPYEPIDNPAIVHAVNQAEVTDRADFQVTPDGDFAAFSSVGSLTGYANRGNSEIYRYRPAPGSEEIDCISCSPTNAAATTDSFLTSGALNLIDDGRVFFESTEALVLRDTNHLQDVYEWADGKTQLISTGNGRSDVGLLTASSDGRDVFFFTRQTLVPRDENGNAMKVYDARADGGFLFIPPAAPCAASDECHGPGTAKPARPPINTVTGQGEFAPPVKKCKRGFVKRHGRCVKKRHKRPHHKHTRKNQRDGRHG
jgi:hypothetical protein